MILWLFLASPGLSIPAPALVDGLVKGRAPGAGLAPIEIGLRLALDLPKRTPDGTAALPLLPAPYGALILTRGSHAETAMEAMLATGTPLIDRSACVLVRGEEHIIKPGWGPILVVMLVRRLPSMTRAAFLHRWRHGHAQFGERMAAPGYRQLHARDANADGFDGVGLVAFDSLAQMRTARASPEVACDATADEMQFIDHSRSMLMAFELAG